MLSKFMHFTLFKLTKKRLMRTCLLLSFLFSSASFAATTLYHLVSEDELASLTKDNIYTPLSIAKEGYIHFSKLSLIEYYANELYTDKDISALYLLKVSFSDDDKNLKWIEDNPDYYIGLDLAMVEEKTQMLLDENKQWILPK
jgi:uncharacterized protein (DUF952 family)